MNDYIVDASVVVQRFIQDVHTANARALFNLLATAEANLIVPDFCLVECANVLWKQVRFQGMPQSQAENLINDLASLPFTVIPSRDLLKRSLQIGIENQLAVYDSVYIALAEKLNLPLITDDARQAKAAQYAEATLKPLTEFLPS
ncbi:MAG: type II toxin-antitoxin system VapC family toxin [Anaerolineae bacterium]|nr:type II toxin-antitoxin system VapC family toxin [Anaerolineae bacterium]